MRLRILSDLHFEFGRRELPHAAVDVVILAGDIARSARGVMWARETFREVPVLYVAGNHEHYGGRIGRLHEKLREAAAGSNVVILENESFEYGGFRFFGATLWTDFMLMDDRQGAMLAAAAKTNGMNDYRKIRLKDTRRLQPVHTTMVHAGSRLALVRFLESGDCARSVIVTHHAPSIRSVPIAKAIDPLTAAYASNLESVIAQYKPRLWIHGHIHESRDYELNATRVVCNPAGYLIDGVSQKTGFRPDFVVDI